MLTCLDMGSRGRFGNQIFQLAALLGVAARSGLPMRLPEENLDPLFARFRDPVNGTVHPACLELLRAFDLPRDWFVPRAEILANLRWDYREPHFHFDPRIFTIPDETSISGFFQSERYFTHIAPELRKVLAFHGPLREEAKRLMGRLANGLPRVAMHVRRGDYVALQARHPVLPRDYYLRALATHFADQPHQVLVFSDDPDWCESAFPGRLTIHTGNPYLELCLMTLCDHFIIANSSFSWWGAWFSPSPGKVVVAPRLWFGPELAHHDTRDLLPEGWHCV